MKKGEVAWLQVFIGQHIIPDRVNPMADQFTEQQLEQYLDTVRKIIGKTVGDLSSHREFINKNCAA